MRTALLIALSFICSLATSAQTVDFRTYGGIGADHAYDLLEVEDGYFLVGSSASAESGTTDIYLVKLNDDLTVNWSKLYGGPGVDQPRAINRLSNGDLVVMAFTTTGSFGTYDVRLYRIDAATGDVIWSHSYGTADWDLAVDMEVINDKLYLLSKSFGIVGSNGHLLMTEVDSDGNTTNEWTISGDGSWEPVDLHPSGDSLFVAYSYTPLEGSSSMVLIKYDDTFTPLWTLEKTATEQEAFMAGELDLNQHGLCMAATVLDQTSGEQSPRFLNIDPITGEVDVEVTDLLSGEQRGAAITWYNDIALVVSETDDTYGAGGQGALVEVRYFEGNWFNATVFGGEDDEIPEGIYKDSQGRVLIWGSTFSYGNGTEEMMLIRLPDNTVNNQLDIEVTTFEDEFVTNVGDTQQPDFNVVQNGHQLQISGLSAPAHMRIYDLQGRILWSGLSNETVHTSDWSTQVVQIRIATKTSYSNRLVFIHP